jgi:hypothetical protein
LTTVKKDIRSLTLENLQNQFVAAGFPAFKAKQAYDGSGKKG